MGHSGISHEAVFLPVAQSGSASRTPAELFGNIFLVFTILGTLVGVVVIGYTLYNAYIYRQDGDDGEDEAADSKKVVRPTLGELPTGSGGGRKLFVSFGISAVIVLSLIVWTYSALLFVEDVPEDRAEDAMEIDVVGQQFSWEFTYPNGHKSFELRVPKGRTVKLNVTSSDVWHNIGIPAFKAKADAIPGQTTSAWFTPDRTGQFEAICYELCGSGHSQMRADVIVMEQDEFRDWYESTTNESSNAAVETGAES